MQDPNNEYDLFIVGGGANGAGVVIDAASRGLKCAVIDKFDFASGTSSRSTKMAHGGIRYFEQMFFLQGDPIQSWDLLTEALHERSYFVQSAPYLNRELQLLTPTNYFVQSFFWYYPACFMYHLMYLRSLGSGDFSVKLNGPKLYMKDKIKKYFPNVQKIHGQYGVIMHEAQMIDSRMALNTLFTSTINGFHPGMKGSNLANYTEFVDFIKDESGKIKGAKVKDTITGKEWSIKAKRQVNCAGIHSDTLRKKDDEKAEGRIQGARGTHVMFKKGMLPNDTGILIPKTKDGRVLFICNYLGHPMVGTTDEKCDVTHYCEPTQKEIDFIFKELEPYFGEDYDYKNNMISAWAGIRPLVKEFKKTDEELELEKQEWEAKPVGDKVKQHMGNGLRNFAKLINSTNKKSSSTAKLSRSHVIEVSNSGLVSLLGGKWTSFRHMGQECVEKIIEVNPEIKPKYDSVQTTKFNLIGSYSKCEALTGVKPTNETLFKQYRNHYVLNKDIPADVADHLIHAYGTTSMRVIEMGEENSKQKAMCTNERIHPDYPFLKSEIAYAIKQELVEKPNDVICRRIPLAFLDKKTAQDLLPEVIQLLANEKKWSKEKIQKETDEAIRGLQYLK